MHKRMLIGGSLLVLLAAAPLYAQFRSAGSKITGTAYREWSAQSYSRAAYGHADALGEFSRRYSYIPADTAAEHIDEIHRNVTSAKKELSKLAPAAKNDPTMTKHIETLNAHYDKVLEQGKAMKAETAKDEKADPAKVEEHTKAMSESLKAADAEHKKLSEHIGTTEKSKEPTEKK